MEPDDVLDIQAITELTSGDWALIDEGVSILIDNLNDFIENAGIHSREWIELAERQVERLQPVADKIKGIVNGQG